MAERCVTEGRATEGRATEACAAVPGAVAAPLLTCAAMQPRGLVSVRADASSWIGDALGVRWRDEMMRLHQQADLRWWSVSPGVWLIEVPPEQTRVILRALDHASRAHGGMVTDISDGRQVLQLAGEPTALALWLERALSIEPKRLSHCSVLSTRIGGFAVTMTGDPAAGGIALSVERSLAESLHAWVIRLAAVSR